MKSLMKNGQQLAEAILTLEKAGLFIWHESHYNQWNGKEKAVEARLAFRLEKDGNDNVVITSVYSDEFYDDLATTPGNDKKSVLVKAYTRAKAEVAETKKKVTATVAKVMEASASK